MLSVLSVNVMKSQMRTSSKHIYILYIIDFLIILKLFLTYYLLSIVLYPDFLIYCQALSSEDSTTLGPKLDTQSRISHILCD